MFVFLYAPIVALVVFSFNDSKSRAKWEGFTLKWYQSMFNDPMIVKALYYTVTIAILAAVISTLVGTIAAIGIHGMGRWTRGLIMNVTYIPLLNPDIVTGIALMLLFVLFRMRLGFLTLLLAHITFCIPYVVITVLPKLRQLNPHTYEAAMDLGASPMEAIWKVIVPEIMPGIITGFLLAFTLSIDDFVISYFTTGNGVTNLSITIFTMTKRGIKPEINAISTLMFVTVLLLLLIVNKRSQAQWAKNNLN
jgi:spermidine/putrescine transport system permease protein